MPPCAKHRDAWKALFIKYDNTANKYLSSTTTNELATVTLQPTAELPHWCTIYIHVHYQKYDVQVQILQYKMSVHWNGDLVLLLLWSPWYAGLRCQEDGYQIGPHYIESTDTRYPNFHQDKKQLKVTRRLMVVEQHCTTTYYSSDTK